MKTANNTMAEREGQEGGREMEREPLCDMSCLAGPCPPRSLAEMPA